MISGSVIFYSAQNRTASEFIVSRGVRLYPSYWFAVLFTSFFAIYWGGDLMAVEPKQILANFTMFQNYLGISNVDGVYWTLDYEVAFYLAVLTILILNLKKHLNYIFIMWPILMSFVLVINKQWLPLLGTYFCYFSAGTLFALLKNNNNLLVKLSLLQTLFLCIFFSTGNVENLNLQKGVEFSKIIIALIVSAFFLFFVVLNSKRGQNLKLPHSKFFGSLTYPVYLIHAHFGYMFINKFGNEENKLLIYALTITIVLLVAYLMHKLIEVKLHPLWKKFFSVTLGKFVFTLESSIKKLYTFAFIASKNET